MVIAALLIPGIALAADAAPHAPSEAVFVAQVILLLVCGRLMGEAMQRIGQPAVMGQLIAGMLLGPSVLGALWPTLQHVLFPASAEQQAMIDAVAQLGILMLLLLTGMETDLSVVRRSRRTALSVSLAGIACRSSAASLLGELLPDCDAARPGAAAHHDAVPRHRAVDLVGQDRRDGGARGRISCAATSAR